MNSRAESMAKCERGMSFFSWRAFSMTGAYGWCFKLRWWSSKRRKILSLHWISNLQCANTINIQLFAVLFWVWIKHSIFTLYFEHLKFVATVLRTKSLWLVHESFGFLRTLSERNELFWKLIPQFIRSDFIKEKSNHCIHKRLRFEFYKGNY